MSFVFTFLGNRFSHTLWGGEIIALLFGLVRFAQQMRKPVVPNVRVEIWRHGLDVVGRITFRDRMIFVTSLGEDIWTGQYNNTLSRMTFKLDLLFLALSTKLFWFPITFLKLTEMIFRGENQHARNPR